MLFEVPDAIPDEVAVFADPFAVSLHSITRHPPPPGGRALVWGAGALGSCAVAILRALYPDVEVAVVARFDAQADLARTLGAHHVVRLGTSEEMLEDLATWSGGVLRPTMEGLDGLAMCHPGGIDVAYDTVGKPETFTIEVRVLKARGTLVKSGVHAPGRWEWSPLYFKEINWVGSNAFGIEEVEGVRKHGIDHYLDLVAAGRIDLSGLLTHVFPLSDWRDAFSAIADQQTAARSRSPSTPAAEPDLLAHLGAAERLLAVQPDVDRRQERRVRVDELDATGGRLTQRRVFDTTGPPDPSGPSLAVDDQREHLPDSRLSRIERQDQAGTRDRGVTHHDRYERLLQRLALLLHDQDRQVGHLVDLSSVTQPVLLRHHRIHAPPIGRTNAE